MNKKRTSQLDDLEARGDRFFKEGNYREALHCAQQALEVAETLFLQSHDRVVICYNNVGFYHYKLRHYKEAEVNYLQAVRIVEDSEGTDSPKLCTALSNLAVLNKEQGRYKEAENYFQRTLKLEIKEYGPANLDVPRLLNNLGVVLSEQGKRKEAEMRYTNSINTWKSLKGPDYPEIAMPMLNLGELYLALGKYTEAEEYIYPALEIQQKAVPPGDHSLASFYCILGRLYYRKGEYQNSLDYHDKALDIRLKVLGEEHGDTAQSYNETAMTLKILGRYRQAESMYLKVLEIYEKIYDGDHPDISNTKNNLALIFEAIGDYQRAEVYLGQAVENKINFQGANHYDLAVFYINKANLCLREKDDRQALEHCEKARGILEEHVEPDNPELAVLYNTMALIYQNQERYGAAEKSFKKSMEIYERFPDPAGLAPVLGNLSMMYQEDNNYAMAEQYLKRSIQIIEDGISPDHPNLIQPLLRLAVLRIVSRNYPSAATLFQRILALQEKYIDMVFSFTDEEQKLAFIDFISTAYLVTLSAIHKHMSLDNPQGVALGFETVVRRKGIVLETEARTYKALQLQMKGALQDTWEQRSQKLSQLAQLIRTPPSGKKDETAVSDHGNKIKVLQKEIDALERELKDNVSPQSPGLSQPGVKVKDIIDALPDRSVLLEFVKIKDYDFSFSKKPWGLTRYIVFVVSHKGSIRLVDLGNTESIDCYVPDTLGAIRSGDDRTKEFLRELNNLVMAPLETYLKGIDRVIICPDGLISLVPFAALIDSSGDYLVKRFTFTHVTSSREIVPVKKQDIHDQPQLVLVAAPQYDHPEGNRTGMKRALKQFERLEGSKRESEKIPPLVPGQKNEKIILTGPEATKEAVLKVVNPRILHLATHGDLNNKDMDALFSKPLTPTELFEEIVPSVQNMFQPTPVKSSKTGQNTQSLAQSSLALAGANHVDPESGNTNGLLTGLEITGMQLQETELVVLSACNTGIGELMPGEGVSGLRRAFALAGARNLVISLWPVSDQYTMVLMEAFYRNLRQMPPAEALQQAQLYTLDYSKKEPPGPIPYFWAPFIIQGGQALTTSIYDTTARVINNTG
jgi:CHAT domain-containing protein/Tfp pilus assembly protein PilF